MQTITQRRTTQQQQQQQSVSKGDQNVKCNNNNNNNNTTTTLFSKKWLPWIFIGILIRLVLFSAGFDETFQKQVEFTTPTTSFKRLVEGLHLIQLNLSPYSSTMFIQPPLILLPFLPFFSHFSKDKSVDGHVTFVWFTRVLYIGLDLLITHLLFQIARMHQSNVDQRRIQRLKYQPQQLQLQQLQQPQQREEVSDSERVVDDQEEDSSDLGFHSNLPHIIAAFYLFNPVMIGSCVSLSTVIFNNLALAATVYYALKGNVILSTMGASLATYLSLYPIVLLVPITLMIQDKQQQQIPREQRRKHRHANYNSLYPIVFKVCGMFAFWQSVWIFLSYSMTGDSWQFVENAYMYPLSIQDLTPNWSNFWYMFTEVFGHFRRFFLMVFHIHILSYILPLTVRFKEDPTFLCLLLIGIISVFKAYATFADTFFYVTLLMMYSHLTKYMRYGFFISVLMTYGMIIGPACFRTWIHKGTGNANFFYFITLLFMLAQVLLLVEFVYAKLKERYELKQKRRNLTATPRTPGA